MASHSDSAHVQLPSFAQAFRASPAGDPAHSHSRPTSHPHSHSHSHSFSRNDSGGNQLPPIRSLTTGDDMDVDRDSNGSRGGGRKRGYDEIDRDRERERERGMTDGPGVRVKPEPSTSPPASQPSNSQKRPRHSHSLSRSPLPPPPSQSQPEPLPRQPISPLVAGFSGATDPSTAPVLRKTLTLKQQQQSLIQSRNNLSSSSVPTTSNGATNSATHTPPLQPPQPPTPAHQTLASRRGPLTASKAASLTILTTPPASTISPQASQLAYPNAPHPGLHHPTSALRTSTLGPTVHSAPPQQTRFDIPPYPGGGRTDMHNLRSDLSLASQVRRPTLSVSHSHMHPLSQSTTAPPPPQPQQSHTIVPGVPVRRGAQGNPTQNQNIALPTPARPLFSHHQQSLDSRDRDRDRAPPTTHYYPLQQSTAPPTAPPGHAFPLPSASLASQSGSMHAQQQQQSRPSSTIMQPTPLTADPHQHPPQPNGNGNGNDRPPTPGKSSFLLPFSSFYDSLSDARRLKDWLNSQLQKAAQLLAALQQSSASIEELFERKVAGVREEAREEVEELRRRVEVLERMLGERGIGMGPPVLDGAPANANANANAMAQGSNSGSPMQVSHPNDVNSQR